MQLIPLPKNRLLLSISLLLVFSSCHKDLVTSNAPTTIRTAGDGNLDLLGYGYDIRGRYADARSAKGKVLDVERLLTTEADRVQLANVDNQLTGITSGKSLTEFSSEISKKVKVTAGFLFFTSEITSNINKIYTDTSSTSFATGDVIVNRRRLTLNATANQLRPYLTASFINDCNQLSAADLVNTYGAAVLRDIFLGGKLHFAYGSRINSTTQKQSAGNGINAGVKGILGINLSVSGEYAQTMSTAEHQKYSNEYLSYETIGGDASQSLIGAVNLGNPSNPSVNVTPWLNSVTRQNAQLIDFGDNALIPIYELIPNAQKRNEVKNYILTQYYHLSEGSDFFLEGKLYILEGNAEWEFYHIVMGFPDKPRLIVPCLERNDNYDTGFLIENAINANPVFNTYVSSSYFLGKPRVLNTPYYPNSPQQDRMKDMFDENDKYALLRGSVATYPSQNHISKKLDLISYNNRYYLRMYSRIYNPANNSTISENTTVFPFTDESSMIYYNVDKNKAISVGAIAAYQLGTNI